MNTDVSRRRVDVDLVTERIEHPVRGHRRNLDAVGRARLVLQAEHTSRAGGCTGHATAEGGRAVDGQALVVATTAAAEALRRELLLQRIAVYVACPSDIDTPQFHAEYASMPDWMKGASAPRVDAMPASVAAQKILLKCKGNRFLFTITPDVGALYIATKILPRRIRDWLLDNMFPRPR